MWVMFSRPSLQTLVTTCSICLETQEHTCLPCAVRMEALPCMHCSQDGEAVASHTVLFERDAAACPNTLSSYLTAWQRPV
jgi:hypothetical protein